MSCDLACLADTDTVPRAGSAAGPHCFLFFAADIEQRVAHESLLPAGNQEPLQVLLYKGEENGKCEYAQRQYCLLPYCKSLCMLQRGLWAK